MIVFGVVLLFSVVCRYVIDIMLVVVLVLMNSGVVL